MHTLPGQYCLPHEFAYHLHAYEPNLYIFLHLIFISLLIFRTIDYKITILGNTSDISNLVFSIPYWPYSSLFEYPFQFTVTEARVLFFSSLSLTISQPTHHLHTCSLNDHSLTILFPYYFLHVSNFLNHLVVLSLSCTLGMPGEL